MKDKVRLYNMTMVVDATGRVLVLDRKKTDWPGLTFPGGHVEQGESLAASAVREVFEETGLHIENPIPCGIVHWADKVSGKRCMEFLYKSLSYTGTPNGGSVEGEVFWMNPDDLQKSDCLSPNFEHYLPLFLQDTYSEAYFDWDGESFGGTPVYMKIQGK